MEWVFILGASIGVPLAVPSLARALWGTTGDHPASAATRPPGAEPATLHCIDDAIPDISIHDDVASPRRAKWSNSAFAGFFLIAAAVAGLVLVAFDASANLTLIAAIAFGLAAGSVHPDLIDSIRGHATTDRA